MCLTDKLCVVCFLVSCLLSFSHASSPSSTAGDSTYIHDHHGYQIVEKSSDVVAGIESRYFVSKIFEKYGGTNGTLKYDKFKSLMLSLGLGKNITSNATAANNSTKQMHRHGDKHDSNHGSQTGSEHNHTSSHEHQDGFVDQDKNSTESHDEEEDDHNHDLHHHGDHDHDHHDHHDHDSDSGHDDHDHVSTVEKDASAVEEEEEEEEQTEEKGANKKKRKKKKKKKSGRKKELKPRSKKELKSRSKRYLEHPTSHSHCLSPSELLKTFHLDGKTAINKTEFMFLCPALLFQLDVKSCIKSNSDHYHGNHDDHDHVGMENHDGHDHQQTKSTSINNILPKVWGYSTVAVIVISLAGLLGVAVIPIMQKVFYNHLLQFLVALAVGALAGDALLHLLPHALGGGHGASDSHSHSEGDSSHLKSTYKGLLALMGIFFFFLMERILTIITELRRKKKQTKRLKSSLPLKPCTIDTHKAVGAKLSTHVDSDYQTCEEMVMIVHPNKALRNLADDTHDSLLHDHTHHHHHHHGNPRHQSEDEESLHSGTHSHHGHAHHVPGDVKSQSVAAIAWMVILGDGIHNFSDGLAIGAAFANSITGGVSTSVAVLCHELPHEIGDFAVLLRAGMNIKQAIMYNCVSSLLCFLGMLIGVALGNLNEASLWIFSCVGGMFLYIALVDMLPEMTSVDTKHGENPFCHLLFQCAGMLLGSGVMFIIALYEPELLSALDKHT